ncbi:hypothetical protein LL06_11835 [Hoeflea sp. BAL378]|uniref:hypothetical protein n=1 Tax=Hoeflea sp. BAL378 TaxID=1547437 RepID=UPI0005136477|nr:hypothetical protein [Hoeflea sp. BAL378]KGF69282.1 hypothetical protein LL06_11835 [Hoeflea sp. BAL378]
MATLVTPEKIAAMSTDARATLYANCLRTVDNDDAVFIVDLIVESGLPYARKKEISHGDPEMRAIEVIVNAPENEAAMLDAVAHGMPPLGVIEPLIVAKLGTLYRAENGGTIAAGYLVAKRLYALDYEKRAPMPMPAGSVARTAATFHKKPGY